MAKIRDYSDELEAYWPTIEQAWRDFADKHPIIVCDLADEIVLAYPAEDYIADLSERTREDTRQLYYRTVEEGQMMVFIRDSANRVLQSHLFPAPTSRKRTRRKREV